MNFLLINGRKVAYQDKGSGPAVLFGHSYLWDSHMWDAVTDQLAPHFRCIVPDLTGHGQSAGDKNTTLKSMASDHAELMAQLGIEEYSLAGLSIGAMWGALLVSSNNAKVNKFAVMNSSLSPEPDKSLQLYESMLAVVDHAGCMPPPILDQIVPGFFSKDFKQSVVGEFRESLENIPSSQIPAITACGRSFINRGDLIPNIRKYKGDVFVIAGHHDNYRSLEEARIIKKASSAEMIVLDAGHISSVERPEEVAGALLGFLNP